MKLDAIKAVLATYRSTGGTVTQEMVQAAWAEHAEVESLLNARQGTGIVGWLNVNTRLSRIAMWVAASVAVALMFVGLLSAAYVVTWGDVP